MISIYNTSSNRVEILSFLFHRAQPLMQKWLSSLLDLCRQDDCGNAGDANSNGPQLDSEKHDFPRGLALHLLRGVFGDAALAAIAFDSPIPEGRIGGTTEYDWITLLACNIALPGFGARQWTVANGSLQLFGRISCVRNSGFAYCFC